MTSIFVDTSAFYALADTHDTNHERAQMALKALLRKSRPLVTSTDVADETITLVRYHINHRAAVEVGERLWRSSLCRTVEILDETRRSAWEIFVRFGDQKFSFTDCTSFALMRAMRITEAFTFDRRDFSVAGFRPFPV